MLNLERSSTFMNSRVGSWTASIASFAAAVALQICIFGMVVPSGGLPNVARPVEVILAAAWLVVPPLLATLLAIRKFGLVSRRPAERSSSALIAALIFPPLSVYLAVVASFNIWGGK
jgi:hypothetical protein